MSADWTMEVNPDWPEAHWTAQVGGSRLHVWGGGDTSDYTVVDAAGHTVAEGKAWGLRSVMNCMAAAEAVAKVEVE